MGLFVRFLEIRHIQIKHILIDHGAKETKRSGSNYSTEIRRLEKEHNTKSAIVKYTTDTLDK